MRLPVAVVMVAALNACGPNPKAPVKVMAIVPSVQGNYETRAVDLRTITSITSLKGTIAELMGGNRVVLDPNDPLQQMNGGVGAMTDAQRYEVIVKDKGMDVRGNYIERSGVLWPADFHTWNMVSTYYNFEVAYGYYQAIYGTDPPELQKMLVMYWPEVRINSATPITDNALYLSFIKAFVIVPAKNDQKIPMAMNLGVIGHEMGHKVFNKRVLQDAGIHSAYSLWQLIPFNLLKSMDEGLADFHGFGVTCLDVAGCRPSFLSQSIGDAATIAMRDISNPKACLDGDLRTAFRTFTPDMWVRSQEMYKYGDLIAVALYQAGNKSGKMGALQKAVLMAYDDESVTTAPDRGPGLNQLINRNLNSSAAITPEAFVNTIVSHIADQDLRKFVCSEFADRLQLTCGAFPCAEMPACPATATRTNQCPVLPQP